MKATITGFKQIRPDYRMVFMRGEDGKCYLTHADLHNGNARKWWNLRKGDVIAGAFTLIKSNIVNADSPIAAIIGQN